MTSLFIFLSTACFHSPTIVTDEGWLQKFGNTNYLVSRISTSSVDLEGETRYEVTEHRKSFEELAQESADRTDEELGVLKFGYNSYAVGKEVGRLHDKFKDLDVRLKKLEEAEERNRRSNPYYSPEPIIQSTTDYFFNNRPLRCCTTEYIQR